MHLHRQHVLMRLFLCAFCSILVGGILPAHAAVHKKKKTHVQQQPAEKPSRQTIRAQKRSLNRLQESIEQTRTQIRSMDKKETTVLQSLHLYRKQSEQLSTHISLIEQEALRVQDSIHYTESSLDSLQRSLTTLQKNYAELCRILYKAGTANDEELVITKESHEKELRDAKYMHNITEMANKRAEEILHLKEHIGAQKQQLHSLYDQHLQIKEEKSAEQQELTKTISSQQQALKTIRTSKTLLQKQLEEKNQSAIKMQRIIALLAIKEQQRRLEDARRRKEAQRREIARREAEQREERNRKVTKGPQITKGEPHEKAEHQEHGGAMTGAHAPERPLAESSDEKLPGFRPHSLRWPVGSRTIVQKYGRQTNPITNTVTDNLGIGIKAARGTSVNAVSEGTVSLVHWLPGYGSLLILDHGNGFRTVYANLSAVLVSEGEHVRVGTIVGRSGESVDGEYLHFEIWREREKLNPTEWLN